MKTKPDKQSLRQFISFLKDRTYGMNALCRQGLLAGYFPGGNLGSFSSGVSVSEKRIRSEKGKADIN